MTAFIDRVGQRYGRLLVTGGPEKRHHPSGDFSFYWACKCDCGAVTNVSGRALGGGLTKSCGCLNSENRAKNRLTHGGSYTPEFRAWAGMIYRCYNATSNASFPDYGGRGIRVCDEWRDDFAAFLAHVGPRPSPKHSIDRYPNNDGNYEPGNVRWATREQQIANRRAFQKHTHCIRGHALTEDNLYIQSRTGDRHCKECRRMRDRNRPPRSRAAICEPPPGH